MSAVRIGPEGLPERTLGWQILGWTAEYLQQPDGPDAGSPWKFTNEQARFLLWWYAIDERGRFAYRYGMFRRMKGHGKDPLGAALACVEFVGPCRFGGFKEGQPYAIPHNAAWVQTAAVSKDQTRNTMTLFPGMFSPKAIDEFGIDLGKEIIYAERGSKRIEAVTSSPRALEGGRATFVLKNETHHWLTNNEGIEMSAVIARNVAKSRDGAARALAISNAHVPGEDSDAEHDYEAWEKIRTGKSRATGFLYDSLEAPPGTDLADRESLMAGILAARGDSHWLVPERLIEEIYDPKTPPSTARRFYLNQIIAAEDAWIAPHEWDRVGDKTKVMLDGDQITLGFDGSQSDDWTALVGCRVSDSHLFTIGLWDPESFGGEIPRDAVEHAVTKAFETFDVVGFYADVHPWESYIDAWNERYQKGLCVHSTGKHSIGWNMTGRAPEIARMSEAFHQSILDGDLTHGDDPAANQHAYNARRRTNNHTLLNGPGIFGKEHRESARKIDWLSAAMLARKARQDYMALPDKRKRRQRTGRAMFV